MNSPFKQGALVALLLVLAPTAFAAEGPFAVVPMGDATYAGLSELESAGLLPGGSATAPLTRFEVAKLLVRAEQKAIVLAQADEIPPPDDSDPTLTEPAATASESVPSPAAESAPAPSGDAGEFSDELEAAGSSTGPSASAGVLDDSPEALKKALRTLRTLKQAYDYEVNRLKGGVQSLEKRTTDLETEQYDLRKRLKGIEQYPTVAMHGLGRARGWMENYWGAVPGFSFYPVLHGTWAYLDMGPEGHVSKEVRWKAMFRFFSEELMPNEAPVFTVRRLEIEFNPPWMDLDVCDFEESYTPLTLWNRNTLDLRYIPAHIAREDDLNKYSQFLEHAPNWHLRGARASTRVQWEEGSVLESLRLSTFVHMIRNGFDDTNGDGWYFGPLLNTDWLLGARTSLSTHDLWVGSSPVKFSMDAQGLMLDTDMGSDSLLATYSTWDPSTWSHRYMIGSVRPELRLGGEAGFAVCLGMEYAHSLYQDDQLVAARTFNDYAMMGGLTLKWADSSIAFNYLNVGPYFYSPMAQLRQSYYSPGAPTDIAHLRHAFGNLLQESTLYDGVHRAGDNFNLYSRTEDNTFPYGLATPNREGFGGELDLRFLEKDALKLRGSAYYAWEINGNLVVNGSGDGFVPVENPMGPTMFTRTFLYINMGPSLDLGPLIGLAGPLEFGVNVRYENTESGFGTLTCLGLVAGFEAEILPFWRLGASVGLTQANGTEMGLAGILLARYPYLYDNTDSGNYSSVTVDNVQNQSFEISNAFPVDRNSTIYLDGGIRKMGYLPWYPAPVDFNMQYLELSYEIKF